MEKYRFITCLRKGIAQLGPDLDLAVTKEAEERLFLYFRELTVWRHGMNLIAKQMDDEEIIEKHFLDSLVITALLKEEPCHLLDIGTGAGFPGLVVKAACPEVEVTLVEPRAKRVTFLRHVVMTLGLQDITIAGCRVEDEKQLPAAAGYTHVTSRAVTNIGDFLRMVGRFTEQGATVLCMKGPRWQEELDDAARQGLLAGYQKNKTLRCRLPCSGAERVVLVLRCDS